MKNSNDIGFIVLGISVFLGLSALGYFITDAVKKNKEFERTVTVRGLSEQEHLADIVIWPILFTQTSNSLEGIYSSLQANADRVVAFLRENEIRSEDITIDIPSVTDRSAQRYGGDVATQYRYVGSQAVTVYSSEVEKVREIMKKVGELGRQGITINAEDYQYRTEYLFTRLNDIKPEMIEEATIEARKVAQKFAEDSDSRLGKIKTASQGQFSISPRDNNNPHIQNVRVVSTIVYYLSD